jgi:hypothetical protein
VDDKWYVNYFDEDCRRICEPGRSDERTEQEADQIVERLGLPPGSAILDLCRGHGRHSIALAERSHQITGQELVLLASKRSPPTIEEPVRQLAERLTRWVLQIRSFQGSQCLLMVLARQPLGVFAAPHLL